LRRCPLAVRHRFFVGPPFALQWYFVKSSDKMGV
jgi:hypothetical protein